MTSDNHTRLIQIEGLSAQVLLNRLDSMSSQLLELQKKVEPKAQTVFLTREQVGELLNVCLSTVWGWTKAGILKSYRVGNQVRYVEAEVIQAAIATKKGARIA
jgi:excisionase family DNA binding protein